MGRYDLHATDDPDTTVGEAGVKSTHRRLLAAANAFVQCDLPYKQIVHVDSCGHARFLTYREQEFITGVAERLGLDVVEIEA